MFLTGRPLTLSYKNRTTGIIGTGFIRWMW